MDLDGLTAEIAHDRRELHDMPLVVSQEHLEVRAHERIVDVDERVLVRERRVVIELDELVEVSDHLADPFVVIRHRVPPDPFKCRASAAKYASTPERDSSS